MKLLDRSRPFGQIFGGGPAFFEQDGILFDQNGQELGATPEEKPTQQTPGSTPNVAEIRKTLRAKNVAR